MLRGAPRRLGRETAHPASLQQDLALALPLQSERWCAPSVVFPQPDFTYQRQDFAASQLQAHLLHGLHG
jgi:hypothetical protein